jgi:ATP/ADP translocase/HEAT repeat protein
MVAHTMQRLVRRIFNVHPGEGAQVLILLLFIFFIQSVLSTGKVLQYSVFLDSFGRKSLALAFVLAPLVLALVAAFYSALTRLVKIAVLVPVTLVVLAAGFVFWRLCLAPPPPDFPILGTWVPEPLPNPYGTFFLYIWVEVAASIAIVQAWAFVSDAFDPRQAKRLIPLVGLGASFSFLLNGFVVHPLVKYVIDAEDLTWLVAFSLLMSIVMFWVARRHGIGGRDKPTRPDPLQRKIAPDSFFGSMRLGFEQIGRTPLLRLFAIITVATILSQGLLDFIFMSTLKMHFEKNELAGFLAMFYGVLGAMQVLLQMFVSGRLLTRLGSAVCLSILPLAVCLGSLVWVILPAFALLVGLRFGDRLLKQAFYSPSLQALYTPVPKMAKRQAMMLIKGVVSPLAFAVFGLILFFFGVGLKLQYLAVGLVVIAGTAFGIMIFKARPAYVKALSEALERRKLDQFEVVEDFAVGMDGETIAFIHAAVFEQDDEGKAVFALRMLSGARSAQVTDLLFKACRHPSAQVRKEATLLIAEMERPSDAPAVAALVADEEDPDVVAQHLVTLATLATEGTAGTVEALLSDSRLRVRAAATFCAQRLDLVTERADQTFDSLAHASNEADRLVLAQVMLPFAHESLAPRCLVLLADGSAAVRGAALRSAGAIRSPTLLADLLVCFTCLGPADEAGVALAALGDVAVPELGKIAASMDAPLALRQRVPRILATVDTDLAGHVLERLLSDPHDDIRLYAIRSLNRITDNPGGYDRPAKTLIVDRIRAEVITGQVLNTTRRGLSGLLDPHQTSLLSQELGHRLTACLTRLFGLAALVEDPKMTAIIHWNIQSGDTRLTAHAIELIDTAFSREVAALVVPLVESNIRTVDLAKTLPEAAENLRLAAKNPVKAVVTGQDQWLRICAAVGWPELTQSFDAPLYQEVQTMLPLIEQILFLQSVPIFRELSGEELHFIAGITEHLSLAKEETLFHAGDPGDAMYLILHGSVSIQLNDLEIVRMVRRDCFGEMAVIDNLPRSADAVAAEDTDLLRIDAQSFDELLQEKHQIVKGIFKVLSSRLRESTAKRITQPTQNTNTPAPTSDS